MGKGYVCIGTVDHHHDNNSVGTYDRTVSQRMLLISTVETGCLASITAQGRKQREDNQVYMIIMTIVEVLTLI